MHICMLIWPLQIYKIAVWSQPSRKHIPEKIDETFKELPNVFGIGDDVLIVEHNKDGTDHEITMQSTPKYLGKKN